MGNHTSISYPNGSSQVYEYDTLNRLSALKTYDGIRTGSTEGISEVVNCTDTYDYEALGEVLKQTGLTVNSYLYIGELYDFCP